MNDQNPEKKNIENDDVEAHRIPTFLPEDADKAAGLVDDTEGHFQAMVDGPDLDEDVEGHRVAVQPPRDADNSGNQF
jgi:hypothetical protein